METDLGLNESIITFTIAFVLVCLTPVKKEAATLIYGKFRGTANDAYLFPVPVDNAARSVVSKLVIAILGSNKAIQSTYTEYNYLSATADILKLKSVNLISIASTLNPHGDSLAQSSNWGIAATYGIT